MTDALLTHREEDLRDQCAREAMAPVINRMTGFSFTPASYDTIARRCYSLADAMLKERVSRVKREEP
jgi:hypothetical protein